MAEENAATESTAARDAEDAQQAQPAADWEAKYKGAMEHARLWEDRAKANVEKAKAYDELSAQAEKSAAEAIAPEMGQAISMVPGSITSLRTEKNTCRLVSCADDCARGMVRCMLR